MAIVFDGINKLILLDDSNSISIKFDIYKKWKEWIIQGDNSKYELAISCIGGDPISATQFLGSTFFLENGWKIRPREESHTLTVSGNLFTRDGSSPFTLTLGSYNVFVDMARSNIVDYISTGDSCV